MILYIEETRKGPIWRVGLVLALVLAITGALGWVGLSFAPSTTAETPGPSYVHAEPFGTTEAPLALQEAQPASGAQSSWLDGLDTSSPPVVVRAFQRHAQREGYTASMMHELVLVMGQSPVRVPAPAETAKILGPDIDGWVLAVANSEDTALQNAFFKTAWFGQLIEKTFSFSAEQVSLKTQRDFRDLSAFSYLCESDNCLALRSRALSNVELFRALTARAWRYASQCESPAPALWLAQEERSLRDVARATAGPLSVALDASAFPQTASERVALQQELQNWLSSPISCESKNRTLKRASPLVL